MVVDNQKRVYVGMSGGVDSSLAAALLVEQGYDVTGVYMKNWTADLPGMKCPWADDLADSKRVAVQLGIDFKVFDFENEYKHKVVDYMINEYKNGHTPNPDIMCNQEVKFKLFLEAALEDGADMIATGHYARVADGILKQAVDKNKDQTYFLYRVTSEAMAKTLFPVGEFTKPQVRKMANERGLTTAIKKDSQGICFIGQIGIRDFLSLYVDSKPGEIIDKKTGKVLGHHDGAIFYTFGQRHGMDLGGGMPYYVVGKDMDKNEVYVTTDLNDDTLWKKTINLTDLHWISQAPSDGKYQIRVRHRAPLTGAELSFVNKDSLTVKLDHPERAIAPGQSVVIYDSDICLGGGIII
ncbi:MAG TPA: tRNA 2-thiouridine(34) synthase MnmA [Candidatus Saccharimonadales bacterium]|nr:tRNA 2-thiouridine(34) synthase MnmA [Candidatus Saccharimonadales bacterium]